MKTPKLLLQAVLAAAALVVPAAARAQEAYPYPAPGYQPMLTPLPPPGPFGDALVGTPLDPYATTVHVVPPTGGSVMLYRDNAMRGWWLQEGLISVKPDMLYSLVATRGTNLVFAAGIVFRPGYTEIVWRGADFPQIAYQPTWPMYPGYGYAGREPAHGRVGHGHHQGPREHALEPRAADVPTASKPINKGLPAAVRRAAAKASVPATTTPAKAAPSAAGSAKMPAGLAMRKPLTVKKPVGVASSATTSSSKVVAPHPSASSTALP
jgi:hypothetical protein